MTNKTLIILVMALGAAGIAGPACRAPVAELNVARPPMPTTIGEDLSPLRDWFALTNGAPRAIALLSPT